MFGKDYAKGKFLFLSISHLDSANMLALTPKQRLDFYLAMYIFGS